MKLLVVDDDAPARSTLVRLCGSCEDVRVIGEAESGAAAIDAAIRLCPDVMLLDVELPDMTGFDVLRAVPSEGRPLSIMMTTRPEHAATALAEGALDYLVKPVSVGRFERAMDRARDRFGSASVENLAKLVGAEHATDRMNDDSEAWPTLLVGERQHRLYPLDAKKIDYIEADGNYVTIRIGNCEYISRDSVKRLSSELARVGYVRISRSLLVNIRSVLFLETAGHGAYAFTLTSGACLYSTSAYRAEILHTLPLAPAATR
ncbi:MAG TPA: LytTR family DNA-binding domain-containing protein [Steroidobacteraceae bacterium]|jgi:DNA-binding LytR/AlgR family response regulator